MWFPGGLQELRRHLAFLESWPLSGSTLCSWGCGHRSRLWALQDGSPTHSQQSAEVTGAHVPQRLPAGVCLFRLHLDAGRACDASHRVSLRVEQRVPGN